MELSKQEQRISGLLIFSFKKGVYRSPSPFYFFGLRCLTYLRKISNAALH